LTSTTTASACLQKALLDAAEAGDETAVELFTELIRIQLGRSVAAASLKALPTICNPQHLPPVLWSVYRAGWVEVARNVVLQACCQLAQCGITPGKDISFSGDESGVPTLHMTAETHRHLVEASPNSLQLLIAFLRVE